MLKEIASSSRAKRRPAIKCNGLVSELRNQIVSGDLGLGARLPVRRELESRFHASPNTVQRALDTLTRDGFVVPQGSRGTFVAMHPPHLARYGLVTCASDVFSEFLVQEGIRLQERTGLQLSFYRGVDQHADSEAYRRLEQDIQSQRLAGLILTNPIPLVITPLNQLWRETGLPVVGIGDHPSSTIGEVMQVSPLWRSMIERALDRFAARKRRRVAVLLGGGSNLDSSDSMMRELQRLMRTRGLTMQPYWLQFVPAMATGFARHVTQLLMQARDRPDALLIADDSLVEPATAGLLDSGARIPDDLEVIAHCNFPYPTPIHVPTSRIGFDVREVWRLSLDLINRRRRGESVAAAIRMPARFDDEVRELAELPVREAAWVN